MTFRRRKPKAYQMRARSREGIVQDIMLLTNQRTYHYDPYYLCFNVKCYSLDFSLKNMLRLWRSHEGDHPYTHNLDWLREVKERHDDINEMTFWQCGIENASSSFVSRYGEGQDVEYAFVGRSGGWLAIKYFNGHHFDRNMENYSYSSNLKEELESMDWADLKKLYQLVLMIRHDTREDARKSEVEWQAAFDFFANVCNDLTDTNRFDEVQLRLFDDQLETETSIVGA